MGLVSPARAPKNTCLYSEEDIERLRYIQKLTTELDMNLAGVEKVIELEKQISEQDASISCLRRELEAATKRLKKEIEAFHRSYRRELILLPMAEVTISHRKRR